MKIIQYPNRPHTIQFETCQNWLSTLFALCKYFVGQLWYQTHYSNDRFVNVPITDAIAECIEFRFRD